MQIDAVGDEYAKQGLTVDEYNINTDSKYVQENKMAQDLYAEG